MSFCASASRVAFMCRNEADKRRKQEAAHHYYGRFDNIYRTEGTVDQGMIRPLPHDQSVEELGDSLLIGTKQEMIDKLAPYAELGIDRVILNVNFGVDAGETLDCIAAFAEDVMPHFSGKTPPRTVAA